MLYIQTLILKIIGEGKSKRLAKRQAAAKMLERLNSMKEVSKHEEEIAKVSICIYFFS